ncbi:predicted protein [Chaetoceros tenuissimus]|uniref:Uncharacterized protein n=1 Tax=Chaetoceros tenuissimus TaxID=426638 RepID=A0AAD3D254_9STRA|nr:predicted protein [Chaetoceros tenuissimus]
MTKPKYIDYQSIPTDEEFATGTIPKHEIERQRLKDKPDHELYDEEKENWKKLAFLIMTVAGTLAILAIVVGIHVVVHEENEEEIHHEEWEAMEQEERRHHQELLMEEQNHEVNHVGNHRFF